MQISCIPNDSSAIGDLPFLEWGCMHATTGELRVRSQINLSVCKTFLFGQFLGFWVHILGVVRIVRPCPYYWGCIYCIRRLGTIWKLVYETPQKQQKLKEKFLQTLISNSMDGPVKSTKTRQGWKKHQKTTLLRNDGGKKGKKSILHLLYTCIQCSIAVVGSYSFLSILV